MVRRQEGCARRSRTRLLVLVLVTLATAAGLVRKQRLDAADARFPESSIPV